MTPIFNLIIKLSQGNVTEIFWDNDCFSCVEDPECYNKIAIKVNKTDTNSYWDKVKL